MMFIINLLLRLNLCNIIQTISVDIEKINDFKINEEQLRQEMLRFLRSLK
jgi:hypothetical protein